MGQGSSVPQASIEELNNRLTQLFANKCYSPLEIYSFRSVFKSLAEQESGVHFWKESTLCKFLEIPDALATGPIIFQMASYLGAFPFPSQAPAILTSDALLKVVTILTERQKTVLKRPRREWYRELYRSLAVYDNHTAGEQATEGQEGDAAQEESTHETANGQGFAIDKPAGDEDEVGQEEEDDELMLAAFESLDATEAFKLGEKGNIQHSIIPSDNLLKMLEFLLLIAPLESQDNLATYGAELDEKRLENLRITANNILSSFGPEKNPGVTYKNFDAVVTASLPNLFDGLSPLFEHFLFDKDFDLSKRKESTTTLTGPPSPKLSRASTELPPSPTARRSSRGSMDMPRRKVSFSMGQFGQLSIHEDAPVFEPPIPERPLVPREPLLPQESDIMDVTVLSQLSFFIKGQSPLFRHMQPLYSGNIAGFSLGSFEKSVFKWQAPTILLVSGALLPATPNTPRSRAFVESLPPKRLPTSHGAAAAEAPTVKQRVTYGAYNPTPWKSTPKLSITNDQTVLFQLTPHHAVFKASSSSHAPDHVYFCKPPATFTGIGFGSPVPSSGSSAGASAAQGGHRLARRASWLGDVHYPIGPVSLHLDDGLEFGVFTHLTSGGGSFHSSKLPQGTGLPTAGDWQDRFEIDALEVWGVGGEAQAEEQRQAWKWEEAEAERRRRINLGTGDQETDRELLRMAGIINDSSRSGGSMG
ncbi:hypothetical protein NA57DRAFT_71939 [Rhizodiscina lignyota]|uniref:Restriction of telomere capping protein 5 n=1 Tax=Rhizodiscina lignyota TaxID=1504668 RepID=A0A9P4MA78_9PEZI|nr:hypothetical protein NA57DRAFT_71939 [Rhizodiscina lignyota]